MPFILKFLVNMERIILLIYKKNYIARVPYLELRIAQGKKANPRNNQNPSGSRICFFRLGIEPLHYASPVVKTRLIFLSLVLIPRVIS